MNNQGGFSIGGEKIMRMQVQARSMPFTEEQMK